MRKGVLRYNYLFIDAKKLNSLLLYSNVQLLPHTTPCVQNNQTQSFQTIQLVFTHYESEEINIHKNTITKNSTVE